MDRSQQIGIGKAQEEGEPPKDIHKLVFIVVLFGLYVQDKFYPDYLGLSAYEIIVISFMIRISFYLENNLNK
jgi:hypothetical protein